MENSSCFNVTFDSDDCKDIFPDNKIANFKVRLPRNIHLNDTWKVGLADVTFSNSRFTFDRAELIEAYMPQQNAPDVVFETYIIPALYLTIEDLVVEINRQLKQTVMVERVPFVVYKGGRIEVNDGQFASLEGSVPVKLRFSPTLENILGLNRWGVPFLNARQPILYLYCSIVRPRLVGDVSAKLLRTVDPSKGQRFGATVSQVFRKIYFCSLDTHDFNEIEIQLLYDVGLEPLFKYGSFRVTLQFKQLP